MLHRTSGYIGQFSESFRKAKKRYPNRKFKIIQGERYFYFWINMCGQIKNRQKLVFVRGIIHTAKFKRIHVIGD